jgi:hypothetical protein
MDWCQVQSMQVWHALPLASRAPEEKGAGRRSRAEFDPTEKKQKVQMSMDSEEEEDVEPLEHKKRTFPMFPQLPDQVVLSGKYVNDILVVAFIGDPSIKKPEHVFPL